LTLYVSSAPVTGMFPPRFARRFGQTHYAAGFGPVSSATCSWSGTLARRLPCLGGLLLH
jgi:hypothetical protein